MPSRATSTTATRTPVTNNVGTRQSRAARLTALLNATPPNYGARASLGVGCARLRPSPGWRQGAMDSVVLLLNSDYEPLNVCDVRRAFRLLFVAKAEVIEYDHHEIRTATEIFR